MPKSPATKKQNAQPVERPETIVNLRPQILQFTGLAAEKTAVDMDSRTIRLIASDETPVMRFDWESWEPYDLILSHNPDHVDLTRVDTGVAMFFDGHPGWLGGTRLGKIKSAKLEGGRLVVEVKINRSEAGDRYLQDVEDGTEPGNSVGVIVRQLEVLSEAEYVEEGRRKILSKPAVMRAIDWELEELSAVDIPANPNAGSKFSISSQEREKLEKLPMFPVKLSGNPGYQPVNLENPMSDKEEIQESSELKKMRAELASAKEQLEDLQAENESVKTERQYFELRSVALQHVALTNRMTEDEFSQDFSGDTAADLKKLSRMSAEDRRIELKFLARSIERAASRDPIERVERESDRARLSKSTIESRAGEGNPAATEAKVATPTGEDLDTFAQRLAGSVSPTRF